MKKTWRKLLMTVVATMLVASMLVTSASAFETPGGYQGSNIIEYVGDYDEDTYPRQNINASFVSGGIVVDGVLDEAYADVQAKDISNYFNKVTSGDPDATQTTGKLRTIWDGNTLYVAVTVLDDDVVIGDETNPGPGANPAMAGKKVVTYPYGPGWPVEGIQENTDSVSIGLDLFNDKFVFETDTCGVITIGADGGLYYFRNSNIPSLSSALGDPEHPEYMNVIQDYAVAPVYDEVQTTVQIGYTVEVAFYIGEMDPANQKTIGLDVSINDVNLVETVPTKQATVFWSHKQADLYKDFDNERPNAVDWGNVKLTGHTTEEIPASKWAIKQILDYVDSASFAKGVYTVESTGVFEIAKATAKTVYDNPKATNKQIADATKKLEEAFAGLRWADTTYPDPADLPTLTTLPNPYKFFNSDRVVESIEDWTERKEEILDLAQFYEYGYKPEYDKLTVDDLSMVHVHHDAGWDYSTWIYYPVAVDYDVLQLTFTVTVGDNSETFKIHINEPDEAKVTEAAAAGRELPIMLGEAGDPSSIYNANGFYTISVPACVSDTRTNAYAWGTRTGQFYNLYPYSRNGEDALKEVSNEMAMAWMTSAVIDALEAAKFGTNDSYKTKLKGIDVTKLGVTGFSINGKYAFVAGVFDERIDVVIPGASGASGTSPWRYVYRGQEYDFSGTAFVGSTNGTTKFIAFGTEVIANSVRHNRVRETELFRHFMTAGRFYEYEEDAYGYGTRLPFDQSDLAATLAPRVLIINNTPNDFNDGSVADALTAEVAISVYNALGYDGENLVLFNYRAAVDSGADPHGSDDAQTLRQCEYMNHYFFGDELSEETETRLKTDPFNLKVCNKRTMSAYTYYWGGFNTITGGTGVEGENGWYYYTFDNDDVVVRDGTTLYYENGSDNRNIFRFEEDLSELVKVKIDGVEVTPKDSWAGSTFVEISNTDLDKLTNGSHTITAVFKNREIKSSIVVVGAPATGDSTILFVIGGIVLLMAAAAVLLLIRKKA